MENPLLLDLQCTVVLVFGMDVKAEVRTHTIILAGDSIDSVAYSPDGRHLALVVFHTLGGVRNNDSVIISDVMEK